MKNNTLMDIYECLLGYYGPQGWWPGDTAFEVIVGALLTQNTNWGNVEKAIANIKKAGMLSAEAIHRISHERLAELIRPAGYYNIKARRLKNLVSWVMQRCGGQLSLLADVPTDQLREELLSIKGVGRETADSILLYALDRLNFVVDAYTCRILSRHELIDAESDYEQVREYCCYELPAEREVYNEFHALLVRVGKEHCKPKPRCKACPLSAFRHNIEPEW